MAVLKNTLIVILIMNVVSCANIAKGSAGRQSLLIAKAVSATYVTSMSGKNSDGTGFIGPNIFEVELTDIKNIQGTVIQENKIKVYATMMSETITSKDKIFLVIEKNPDGKINALYWDIPSEFLCVPKEMIDGNHTYLDFSIIRGKEKCFKLSEQGRKSG